MQKRFNHYNLIEQIGSKPLRSAYRACHINDISQEVLLKIFDTTCLALNQENEQLLDQMEWVKQLRHEHIVSILDLGVEERHPYVVSEYLSGGSLRHYLDNRSLGHLSLQEALNIILQVGQALSYLHRNAHLHQNIKPENIFFNNRGEVLLADFHLSGFIDVALLDYQSDLHNLCYMAPEQFIGSASEKSDQYALACLAYELIAGRVPFSAQSFAMMWASHYAAAPIPLSDLVPGLPKRIGEAIFKAMAKDPSERYADIPAFLQDLKCTGESTVLAITRPVTLFALDPFPMGGTESLEKMQADSSVGKSLADMPSEGSLTTAPFGASLPGVQFGASLPGVQFGASLPGVQFGASLPGVPFGASLPGVQFGASLPGVPFGASLPGVPFGASLPGVPFGASLPGVQLGTNLSDGALGSSLPGVPFGTSLQEEKTLGENPLEVDQLSTPLTTYSLERWEYASKEPHAKTNLSDMSAGSKHGNPFSIGHFWRNIKYSISAPLRLLAITSWLIKLRGYLGSLLDTIRTNSRRGLALLSRQPARLLELWKLVSTKKVTPADGLVGDAPIKPLLVGWIFQRRRDSISKVLFGQRSELPTPVLWFVLVASIIVLIAGIASYNFWRSQALGQSQTIRVYKKQQVLTNTKKDPIVTQLLVPSIIHTPGKPTP
jgi:serine/threonine protein kinase